MLIEPTETEGKEAIDGFVQVMKQIASDAKADGAEEAFHALPHHTPRGRLDEVKAARNPVLRWP